MGENAFLILVMMLAVAFWLSWNRHEVFGVKGCDCSLCKRRSEKERAEAANAAAYERESQRAEKLAGLSPMDRKLHRLVNHPNCPDGLFVGNWDRLKDANPPRTLTPEELEWRKFFEEQQAKADYRREHPEDDGLEYGYDDYLLDLIASEGLEGDKG